MTNLQRVRETIENSRSHIERGLIQSEADVEHHIVSPLLHCLGWGPAAGPASVRRQYTVDRSYRFDYALFAEEEKIAVVIEAKAPGRLDAGARDQLLLYAMRTGTGLGLTTDGRIWSFYLPLERGSAEQKLVQSVDLDDVSLEGAARVLDRYLSRRNVLSGEALAAAEEDRSRAALQDVVQAGWKNLTGGSDDKLARLLARAAKAAGADRWSGRALLDASREFIRQGFAFPPGVTGGGGNGRSTGQRPIQPGSRKRLPGRRAAWTYRGERRLETNVTDMYVAIIGRLYKDAGGTAFYVQLQQKIRGRKRTNIAESPAGTGVPSKSVRPLPGGWHISTNLSTEAKLRYLRCACDAAGIAFGSDLVVETNVDEGA